MTSQAAAVKVLRWMSLLSFLLGSLGDLPLELKNAIKIIGGLVLCHFEDNVGGMLEAMLGSCGDPLGAKWWVGTEEFRGPKMGIPFEREPNFQESARYRVRGVGEGAG